MPDPTTRDQAAVPAECCPVLIERETLRRIHTRFEQCLRQWANYADGYRAYDDQDSLAHSADATDIEAQEYRACKRVANEIDALLAEVGR